VWPAPVRALGRLVPRTFQARLTLSFVGVVALTLLLVSALVIKSLDDYFYNQEQVDLSVRAATVLEFVKAVANTASGDLPVIAPDNTLNDAVKRTLSVPANLSFLADRLGQANVQIRLGSPTVEPDGSVSLVQAPGAIFAATLAATALAGQATEPIRFSQTYPIQEDALFNYAVEITLSDPYTFKASTLRDVAGVLLVIAFVTLGLAVIVASFLAHRLTMPMRRLTEAARRLAEGDLTSRVPAMSGSGGFSEVAELSAQFNHMASQLEESVEIIRRDRDRSRDFLADVSHELRTPLAALRTFNELLMEQAGSDPEARAEFLEASGQQIERLDWLAQNLLELSKLDSGLVLLDLRPDDLRTCVESAVEQAGAAARRRGVRLTLHMTDQPVRIWHDPQRIGQVVSNLVGNALKFSRRNGTVDVELRAAGDGAQIEVRDTGVGIDPAEMPRIFERFYRGSSANEARGSGSGLGLAIVKSIVDMHGGRIAVESRLGVGTTFVVTLLHDPRTAEAIALEPPQMSVASGPAWTGEPEQRLLGSAGPGPGGGPVTADDRAARLGSGTHVDATGGGAAAGAAGATSAGPPDGAAADLVGVSGNLPAGTSAGEAVAADVTNSSPTA